MEEIVGSCRGALSSHIEPCAFHVCGGSLHGALVPPLGSSNEDDARRAMAERIPRDENASRVRRPPASMSLPPIGAARSVVHGRMHRCPGDHHTAVRRTRSSLVQERQSNDSRRGAGPARGAQRGSEGQRGTAASSSARLRVGWTALRQTGRTVDGSRGLLACDQRRGTVGREWSCVARCLLRFSLQQQMRIGAALGRPASRGQRVVGCRLSLTVQDTCKGQGTKLQDIKQLERVHRCRVLQGRAFAPALCRQLL